MDKKEIKQIDAFLKDVYEGICENDGTDSMRLYLSELYRVIKRLMDETFKITDQDEKIALASLEYKARRYKEQIEKRLAVRN